MDFNNLSPYFIKKIMTYIVTPIQHILNLSFSTGVVPEQLKMAKVVPVYKSGDKMSCDNYRPISLLNTFSKIMEKIVANRIITFLNDNNLISKWQFGFRKKHSTIHPMIHFLNHVSEALNKKKYTIGIFCDLKKAFDTCDHQILLDKLKKYGVSGSEHNWCSGGATFLGSCRP